MSNFKGNDRLLFGMIFGIATYWLFGNAITASVPPLIEDLEISSSVVNTAVSITALICGVSIVTAGSLADRIGSKGYNAAVITNFLLNMCAGCLFVLMPYIQTGRGLSSFQSGLLTISYLIAILLTIRVGEKVMLKVGSRIPMAIGTLMAAVGIFLMTLTFLPDVLYYTAVVVGLAIIGNIHRCQKDN